MNFEDFSQEIKLLESLFGEGLISANKKNLKNVFEATESCWEDNLKYIQQNNIKIKYLLFGEAPPGGINGVNEDVKYIYNPKSIKYQSYLINVYKCFFPTKKIKVSTPDVKMDLLRNIADRGFLLIDSLPFAMNYSGNYRGRKKYSGLIKECTNNYLNHKLNKCGVPWINDESVLVAFSVRKTGEQVIKHIRGLLPFRSNLDEFNENFNLNDSDRNDPYAVDGSNYLAHKQLKRIFQLE